MSEGSENTVNVILLVDDKQKLQTAKPIQARKKDGVVNMDVQQAIVASCQQLYSVMVHTGVRSLTLAVVDTTSSLVLNKSLKLTIGDLPKEQEVEDGL
jgi:hypothetical protein